MPTSGALGIQFPTISQLCILWDIPVSRIDWMCSDPSRFYNLKSRPDKKGKIREFRVPCGPLVEVQGHLKAILSQVPVSRHAHGWIKNRSIKTNSRVHFGHAKLFKADIADFFPSVTTELVRRTLVRIGFDKKTAFVIAALTTVDNQLPQGAKTSPVIANLVLHRLDENIGTFADRCGFAYSRFGDDIAISGNSDLRDAERFVCRAIQEQGFRFSARKTRIVLQGESKIICGVSLNGRPCIPRERRRHIRQMVHIAETQGVAAVAVGDESVQTTINRVLGNVAHYQQFDPRVGRNLRMRLKRAISGNTPNTDLNSAE